MPVKDVAREAAWSAMQAARDDVTRVAREMYADPEPAGHEVRAAERLCALLEQHGFEVERGVAGLPTAFRATKRRHHAERMRKGLRHGHVAYLAEYDALPGVGHAHGHHLGAGAAVLAAIGLAGSFAGEYGTVTVFGCPASETHGGKVAMTEAKLFEEPDVALGAHPAPPGLGYLYTIDNSGDTLAELRATVAFRGDGAADAARSLAVGVEGLRADFEERDDVAVTLADDGAAVEVVLRARDRARLHQLRAQVRELALAEAGVIDGEPTFEMTSAPICDDMLVNRVLARRVKTCGDNLGLRMDSIEKGLVPRVTDWGNLSRVVSACEALFPITTKPVSWGEPSFAEAANTDEAYEQMVRMGECLCFTGYDVLRDMNFRAIVDSQLVKSLKAQGVERPFRRWLGVHPVLPKPVTNGNGRRGPKVENFRIIRGPGLPPEPLDDEDDV